MALNFVVLAAALAYANAGLLGAPAVATYSAAPVVSSSYFHQATAPVAVAHAAPVVSTYSAAPIAIHAPAIGSSQQSVQRSLGGAQSVSHYSKAVDSAFSSVRKYDTRITNDAPVAVAHAAPIISSYSAPTFAHYSAAPAFSSSYLQAAAPVSVAHGPVISAYSSPLITKSVAPVVSNYAAHATPIISHYSAPLVTKSLSPVASYAPGPIVAKSAVAYSPASVVAHTTFTGLGASYQW